MEILLEWKSEDEFQCDKREALIPSITQANYILSNLIFEKEYIIQDKENNIMPISKITPVKDLTFTKENTSFLQIVPTNEFSVQIKNLMNICRKKERKYTELKQKIETFKKSITIDANLLNKKTISLIQQPSEYYYKLRNKIIVKLHNFKRINKEIICIQQAFIKYKASKIMTLYYKMAYERFRDVMTFVFQYGEIFGANDVVLPILIQAYQNCVRQIVSEANVEISAELEKEQIYKEHVTDYKNIFSFIVKFFELLPLLKVIDNKCPQVVFSALDEPIRLKFTERNFYHVKIANMQLPTYENLQYEFKDFKDENLRRQAIEMTFKRDFAIYKKFGMLSNQYVYSSLLYEN